MPTDFVEIGKVILLVRHRTLLAAEGDAGVLDNMPGGVRLVAVDALLGRRTDG